MKKNLIIILITIFLNSCGYTALYKDNNLKNLQLNFEIIDTSGDSEINNYILTDLNKYQNTNITEKMKDKLRQKVKVVY